MSMKIKIGVAGASGRMGQMLIKSLVNDDRFSLVGLLESSGHEWIGFDVGKMMGVKSLGILVSDDPLEVFSKIQALLSEKKSFDCFLIISASFVFKIFNPDLLHVTIWPSLFIVMTPLDILESILSLYFLDFETSSKSFAFSSAIATCCVKALSLDSSSSVNLPPLLFKT